MKMYKTCEWCANDFEAVRISQRFCSKECCVEADKLKKRWERKAKRKLYAEQICVVCGNKFTPTRSGQITCGGECAIRHSRGIDDNWTPSHSKKVLEVRKCIICNKEFNPNTYRQVLCGDPECKKLRSRETTKKHPKKVKKYVPKKKTGPTLAELAAEARSRGISYGDLIAEKERGVRCQNIARRA